MKNSKFIKLYESSKKQFITEGKKSEDEAYSELLQIGSAVLNTMRMDTDNSYSKQKYHHYGDKIVWEDGTEDSGYVSYSISVDAADPLVALEFIPSNEKEEFMTLFDQSLVDAAANSNTPSNGTYDRITIRITMDVSISLPQSRISGLSVSAGNTNYGTPVTKAWISNPTGNPMSMARDIMSDLNTDNSTEGGVLNNFFSNWLWNKKYVKSEKLSASSNSKDMGIGSHASTDTYHKDVTAYDFTNYKGSESDLLEAAEKSGNFKKGVKFVDGKMVVGSSWVERWD